MIIWINGVYGVGKSTIANALMPHIPGALLYDPEPLGYYLRDIVRPIAQVRDYQDLALFTPLVIEVARQLHTYGRPLVMPLGVWNPAIFAEIRCGLAQISQLRHYTLTASRQEINRRLLYRGDSQQAQRWIHARLEEAQEAMHGSQFGVCISTDGRAPSDVLQSILTHMAHYGMEA